MPRRPNIGESETLRRELTTLLQEFEVFLREGTLREKVLALRPAFHKLRDLGCSLLPRDVPNAARERIIYYFTAYPNEIISGEEIAMISGISEYARRIRELRVQYGWKIYSGVTLKELAREEGALDGTLKRFENVKVDDYLLTDSTQDRDAAFRWNVANSIRRRSAASRDKILEYFQANVGKTVSGEELRYVSGDKSEWARRVRELRTELGWAVVSKQTGRPDLPIGAYLLESLRQAPPHDRVNKDSVRAQVLERDRFSCVECGWNISRTNPADPRRFLELHHIKPHAEGGGSDADNLITFATTKNIRPASVLRAAIETVVASIRRVASRRRFDAFFIKEF